MVHALPSSQAPAVDLCWHPALASQLSAVHGLLSSHVTLCPGAQPPPRQWSPVVHALPSLQVALLARCVQPMADKHASSLHGLPSSQPSAAPPTQPPSTHVSPMVHALPSLQGAAFAVYLQPRAASQLSIVQGLPSVQLRGLPPVHAVFQHVSLRVHALPSSHAPPCARCEHPVCASQPSAVHGLPSSQPLCWPLAQPPP